MTTIKNPALQFTAENTVGYLLGRARTKLSKSLDVALARHDITNAQGRIVLMLASGNYATAADLGRELYIDSASMTRMIDRLEKRGVIERVRSQQDRRVTRLELTDDGNALAALLPVEYISALDRNFADFKADEVELLKTLLRKYLDSNTDPI